MNEVLKLLERQAAWQKRRKEWSWPDKIRAAETIRHSILQLRRTGGTPTPSPRGERRTNPE